MDKPDSTDAIDTPGTPAGAGPPAVRVQLSSHAAFTRALRALRALRARAPNLEPVVRVTFRKTADRSRAPLTHLTLLATDLRRAGDGSLPAAVVTAVRLAEDLGAGQIDPADQGSRRGRGRAELARAAVGRAVEHPGLRAGGGASDAGEPAVLDGTESG